MVTLLVNMRRSLNWLLFFCVLILILGGSNVPPGDQGEQVRAFTRNIEFDYVTWTLDALAVKWAQISLGGGAFLPIAKRSQIVLDYLDLVNKIWQVEGQVKDYANPDIPDPKAASASLRKQLDELYAQNNLLGPLAETVLQNQLAYILADMGLTLGGQPIPPVLYHTSNPPLSLIVSPRNVIREDQEISVSPDLTLNEIVALEDQVAKRLNVSTLVTEIGGVGLYPTMVTQTNDINWLADTVTHEWTHNFLTLRPLGISYLESPQLRTMNETTANIAGKEIGRLLVARFYPDQLPPEPTAETNPSGQNTSQQPLFNYQAEMHKTRVTVDKMLAEGKIEEAEAYMEARRRFLWEHGYHLRKLNQAYFAFHGAYADEALGAAGEDPVGSAVRLLRAQSPSVADFIRHISWMWSFEQLKQAVSQPNQ
jgi:hypothetical protein